MVAFVVDAEAELQIWVPVLTQSRARRRVPLWAVPVGSSYNDELWSLPPASLLLPEDPLAATRRAPRSVGYRSSYEER
jgi:hypothetical protein